MRNHDLGLAIPAMIIVAAIAARPTEAASITPVPSSTSGPPGSALTVTLVGDFSDEPTIGGGIDITWDPAHLQLLSWQPEPIGDPGFFDPGTVDGFNGTIFDFEFGDFNGIGGVHELGTLTFVRVAVGVTQVIPSEATTFVSAIDFQPMDVYFQGTTNIIRPANDSCSSAMPIDCGETLIADNGYATSDPTDPDFPCRIPEAGPGTNSLWYRFVATHETARISTCSSGAVDSLLGLYAGECSNFVQFGCGEDECVGLTSEICANSLTIGETYYIQLASWDLPEVYTLQLECPCPDLACPTSSIVSNPPAFDDLLWALATDSTPTVGLLAMPYAATGASITDVRLWPHPFTLSGEICQDSTIELALCEDDGGQPGAVRCALHLDFDEVFDDSIFQPVDVPLDELVGGCDLAEGWLVVQGYGGDPACNMALVGPESASVELLVDAGGGYIPSEVPTEIFFCLGTSQLVGACCIEMEPCVMVTEADCVALGGIFVGPGTPCSAVPCGRTVMQEPFLYASDASLQRQWDGTPPPDSHLLTGLGNPNNSYYLGIQPSSDRLRWELDESLVASNGMPVIVEFDLYLHGGGSITHWIGANQWLEFGGHTGGDFGVGDPITEFRLGMIDDATGNFLDPYDFHYFQVLLLGDSLIGFTLDPQPSTPNAPPRSSGWHRFRCELFTAVAKIYIDGNLTITIGGPTPQVVDWIRLGSGLDTAGQQSRIDNVRVATVPQYVPALDCLADITGSNDLPDGTVDVTDLLLLLSNWGTAGRGAVIAMPPVVDTADLLGLLAAWGPCP